MGKSQRAPYLEANNSLLQKQIMEKKKPNKTNTVLKILEFPLLQN